MDNLPRIKKAVLTRKLNISIEEELYNEYMMLKEKYGVDMPECLREAFRETIERVKKACMAESSLFSEP